MCTGHLDSRRWGPRDEPEQGLAFKALTKQRGRGGLPAGRLLCIEDRCWVDVQFMIITDGPWEAEQFCLKYILNTFSKTFPQMHLNSSKTQAVLHTNKTILSIFSQALYDPSPTVTPEIKNKSC